MDRFPAGALRLLDYHGELRSHFERLNREWIERFFAVEESDVRTERFGSRER